MCGIIFPMRMTEYFNGKLIVAHVFVDNLSSLHSIICISFLRLEFYLLFLWPLSRFLFVNLWPMCDFSILLSHRPFKLFIDLLSFRRWSLFFFFCSHIRKFHVTDKKHGTWRLKSVTFLPFEFKSDNYILCRPDDWLFLFCTFVCLFFFSDRVVSFQ